MTKKERKRRPDLQRTEPIRNWGTLFKSPNGGNANMAHDERSSNGHDEGAWDSVISRAVETGYKVIEDQIQQGRQFARQFAGDVPPGPEDGQPHPPGGSSASELLERLMHFYSDMGSLCFDMFDSVARNPAFGDMLRSAMPGAARSAHDAQAAAGPSVSVEIASAAPTHARCRIEWLRPPGDRPVAVSELRALAPDCPSLTAVEFETARDGWLPVLRIGIPRTQPPGNYSGMIVDAVTNEPCATVMLEIPAPTGRAHG